MADAPKRVRVVLSEHDPRGRSARVSAKQEIEEQTPAGEVLVQGLIRAQLGLAIRLSLVVAGVFGLMPALFAVFPAVASTRLLGLPLPWLLLGLLAYPFIWAVAWFYVRQAERNEQDFAAVVERS